MEYTLSAFIGVRHFSEFVLQKQNSIPLRILRHVYKIHLSKSLKMCSSNEI